VAHQRFACHIDDNLPALSIVSVEEYQESVHERGILRLLVQGDREMAAGKG
jgi:hypothetical protein